MQVLWLKTALKNLEAELDYIAQENPQAAMLVSNRILESVDLLSHQPQLGKPGRVAGTRELLVPNTRYVIPYRLKQNRIEILRVFHTSRKPVNSW